MQCKLFALAFSWLLISGRALDVLREGDMRPASLNKRSDDNTPNGGNTSVQVIDPSAASLSVQVVDPSAASLVDLQPNQPVSVPEWARTKWTPVLLLLSFTAGFNLILEYREDLIPDKFDKDWVFLLAMILTLYGIIGKTSSKVSPWTADRNDIVWWMMFALQRLTGYIPVDKTKDEYEGDFVRVA